MIGLDLSGVTPFLEQAAWKKQDDVSGVVAGLMDRIGPECEATTWLNLPESYNREEFRRVKAAATKIQGEADALLVIGVGGSYLGARAGIELLRSPNYNLFTKSTPNIYYVGNNLSGEHINELGMLLRDKNFSINVISKSGETLESAIAFRIFRNLLISRYGDIGARGRIYVTTDRTNGVLREIADKEGFETFTVPGKIGGRYSILTSVGLLPMAVAGLDIDRIMAGAFDAMKTYTTEHTMENPVWQYAAVRQALHRAGRQIEVLAGFEPSFRYMGEWWKQLYGESEGKNGGGIFPAYVDYTADLHSMGQYMQDGTRNMMETMVSFDAFRRDILVPAAPENIDGLDYLTGRGLQSINAAAKRATIDAHVSGGVPVMELTLPEMSETAFGWLVFFFQFACAVSAGIQGVDAFDQPGVEAYKKNMFRLLGRP